MREIKCTFGSWGRTVHYCSESGVDMTLDTAKYGELVTRIYPQVGLPAYKTTILLPLLLLTEHRGDALNYKLTLKRPGNMGLKNFKLVGKSFSTSGN